LVVVDEQHRFGVEQRAALTEKGKTHPHVLVMTATPIPRSVAMSVFGDLEVSTLAELPAERNEVTTNVVATRLHRTWLERVWQRVNEEVTAGHQVFVVAPRINATESDPKDEQDPDWQPSVTVEGLFTELHEGALRGVRLAKLHGKMDSNSKTETMREFAEGRSDVLISTTVIEVGVDVPNATMMVVMDADRFGISQLHQLRGRIGRGELPGLCLLVSNADPASKALERINAVASTRDGFELAELDLEQRREGDVLGANQSGRKSSLKLLRVLADSELIAHARELAEVLVTADPELSDLGLSDMVTQLELTSADEWLERS
jgi:ATP-dependent DNA helicase RecG